MHQFKRFESAATSTLHVCVSKSLDYVWKYYKVSTVNREHNWEEPVYFVTEATNMHLQ